MDVTASLVVYMCVLYKASWDQSYGSFGQELAFCQNLMPTSSHQHTKTSQCRFEGNPAKKATTSLLPK